MRKANNLPPEIMRARQAKRQRRRDRAKGTRSARHLTPIGDTSGTVFEAVRKLIFGG